MASATNLRSQILTAAGLIERASLLVRGHKVVLDADLATLYRVSVGGLNQQIARNRDREWRRGIRHNRRTVIAKARAFRRWPEALSQLKGARARSRPPSHLVSSFNSYGRHSEKAGPQGSET